MARVETHCPWFAVIIAVLSGFLFGYNVAVISGALAPLVSEFHLTLNDESFLVSILLVGALLGTFFAGTWADRFGRKKVILFTTLLFALSSALMAGASSYMMLLLARAINGFAAGVIAPIAPLYLAEIAPPSRRGMIVSSNQLMITLGVLAAYLVNFSFASSGNWRLMFACGILPALVQLGLGFFLPESPVWQCQGKEGALLYHTSLKCGIHHKGSWKSLLQRPLLPLLLIGLLLSIFQQITGINAVIYYAPKIFHLAGFSASTTSALFATVGIGTINVLATLLSVWLLDKVGRRPLLLIGMGGMVLSLSTLALAFFTESAAIDRVAVLSLMSYVAFFEIGIGPIGWLIISEIYPLHVRGKAMTVANFGNWASNYLVAFTFLHFIRWLGTASTFCFYALIGAVAFWFIWRFVPETKGKSLEQLESELLKAEKK